MSNEVKCQFIRTVCFCVWNVKEVGFAEAGFKTLIPKPLNRSHKPYFLALSKCKTNHSNELTFDLVADLLVTL